METRLTLEKLPVEILASIFESMDLRDIIRGGYVSRQMRAGAQFALSNRYNATSDKLALRKDSLREAGYSKRKDVRWIRSAVRLYPDSEMISLMRTADYSFALGALMHIREFPSLTSSYIADSDNIWATDLFTFDTYAKRFTDLQMGYMLKTFLELPTVSFQSHFDHIETLLSIWIKRSKDVTLVAPVIKRLKEAGSEKYHFVYFLARCPDAAYAEQLAGLLGILDDPNLMLAKDEDLDKDRVEFDDILMHMSSKIEVYNWAIDVVKHVVLHERTNKYRERLLVGWERYTVEGDIFVRARPKCNELRTHPDFTVDYNNVWNRFREITYDHDAAGYMHYFSDIIPDGWKADPSTILSWEQYTNVLTDSGDEGPRILQRLKEAGLRPDPSKFADYIGEYSAMEIARMQPDYFSYMFKEFVNTREPGDRSADHAIETFLSRAGAGGQQSMLRQILGILAGR